MTESNPLFSFNLISKIWFITNSFKPYVLVIFFSKSWRKQEYCYFHFVCKWLKPIDNVPVLLWNITSMLTNKHHTKDTFVKMMTIYFSFETIKWFDLKDFFFAFASTFKLKLKWREKVLFSIVIYKQEIFDISIWREISKK